MVLFVNRDLGGRISRHWVTTGSRNLMVAGRSAAGDKEANSAYRVQASCMGMGQAAGALAALAVRHNCDVEDVPLPELYEVLTEYGAIVPGTVKWP